MIGLFRKQKKGNEVPEKTLPTVAIPDKIRTTRIVLIVGGKGSGKSTFINEILKPIAIENQHKILIADTVNNGIYNDTPVVSKSKFGAWCRNKDMLGPARLIINEPNYLAEMITFHFKIYGNDYPTCTLFIEDAKRLTGDNLPKALDAYFQNSKQFGVDIVMPFHSIVRVPPRAWDLADELLLFKSKCDEKEIPKRIKGDYADDVLIAYNKLKQPGYPDYTPIRINIKD